MVHTAVGQEAVRLYSNNMNNFIQSSSKIPNGIELRQAHAQFKLAAMDYLRVNSIGECRSWKLELELNNLFDQFNQKRRRELLKKRQE